MIRRTVLIGLLAVASLGVTAAPAAANAGDIITRGHCSGATVWKLKLSREDGRLETEFEVDQNLNNRLWNVSIYQNGANVYRGSRYTRAPSGSFEVRRLLVNRAGRDRVAARAVNARTGEVCVGSATSSF
jgi:hypothetical protein